MRKVIFHTIRNFSERKEFAPRAPILKKKNEIVNVPFLDRDVPRAPSYGIYISQLIRFARVCNGVARTLEKIRTSKVK